MPTVALFLACLACACCGSVHMTIDRVKGNPFQEQHNQPGGLSTSRALARLLLLFNNPGVAPESRRSVLKKSATWAAGAVALPSCLAGQGAAAAGTALPGSAVLPKQRQVDLVEHASLGVIRLDYDYPPAPGDIDSPKSFPYDVFYRVVPGLTFEMCQKGKMPPEIEQRFLEAMQYLIDEKEVSAITGDCGFMMYFQRLARRNTHLPIFMSALVQLPAITAGYADYEEIAILTANGKTLEPMRDLIRDECGVDTQNKRYHIIGCEDVPGFEAVALGEKVDVKKVTPGIVAKAKEVVKKYPNTRAFLMECTELPPYSDAVRHAIGLPVYDAITCCNMFMRGLEDNTRFGLQEWREKWDGKQDEYSFGQNLDKKERAQLVNKPFS